MTTNHNIAKILLSMVFLLSMVTLVHAQNKKNQVLKHVVAFQFKDDISKERQVQAVKDFVALKDQIPGIKKFEGGEDLSVEGLTKGMTHCFILTFKDEEARDNYLPHPAHLKLVEKNKPLMKDLMVVDVWGEK